MLLLLISPGILAGMSQDSAAQHFAQASQLAEQGRIKEAEQEYRAGLALDPTSAEGYNNLAALYFRTQQFRDAAAAFRKAHDLRPGDATISFNLGLALFSAGEAQAALGPLEYGTADPTHTVDAHFLLGVCYFELNRWSDSIKQLKIVRRSRPENEKVLFILAKDYHNSGKPAESLEAATELLKAHPNSIYAHEMLGEAYDSAGQFRSAEEEYRRAIRAWPQAPELHFMLGYLYWRWKHYAQAVAPLEAETRISSNLPQPYFYLGDVALRDKQFDTAENYFRQALRLKPSYGEADLGLGRALAQSGHDRQSIPFLRLAVRRLPASEEAHYWLGKTLVRAGHKREGEEELEQFEKVRLLKREKASEMLKRGVRASSSGSQ